LSDALAEAAWADADAALAEALADLDELEASKGKERAASLARMAQSLARAGRKRGLSRIGVAGASEPFDPARHELIAAVAKTPKKVRIAARGVARGGDVLVKARVAPADRKRP
jgi:molecular chaperone GrpE (heat shock protein)